MKMRDMELPERYAFALERDYIDFSVGRDIELGFQKGREKKRSLKILGLIGLVQLFYLSAFLSVFI